MRYIVIAALVSLASGAAHAQRQLDFSAIEDRLKLCFSEHPDIPGSAICETAAFSAADHQLNQIYAKAMDALQHPGKEHAPYEPEIVKRLIVAERAWITFRDSECTFKSSVAFNAPLEGYEYQACLYDMTKARIMTLMAADMPQNAR